MCLQVSQSAFCRMQRRKTFPIRLLSCLKRAVIYRIPYAFKIRQSGVICGPAVALGAVYAVTTTRAAALLGGDSTIYEPVYMQPLIAPDFAVWTPTQAKRR